MTTASNIVTSTIDATYPVSGQDNDTQGFRDNFSNIKMALDQAKSEITELQNYSVLTGSVDTVNHVAVINNLNNSVIINGSHNQFYGTAYHPSAANSSGAIEIDLINGTLQKFKLTVDTSLTFKNWPATAKYALVRIHLIVDDASPEITVDITSITSQGNGVKYAEASFPSLHIGKTSEIVFDAWSHDNGTTFFLKYIGEFQVGV